MQQSWGVSESSGCADYKTVIGFKFDQDLLEKKTKTVLIRVWNIQDVPANTGQLASVIL